MTTRYKLTHADNTTHGKTLWGEGIQHSVPGTGNLCGPGWIHVYPDPVLAVFLDPIHGNFGDAALLWHCDVSGRMKSDRGLKEGWQHVTTAYQVERVQPTNNQRIAFGIYCAQEVNDDVRWNRWAAAWLSGKDRTKSADEAAKAAWAAARATAEAAAVDLPTLAARAMEFEATTGVHDAGEEEA